MTVDDVLKFYRTGYQFSKRSGISPTSLYNWKKLGYIPIVSQMRIEKISNGNLKADIEHARGQCD